VAVVTGSTVVRISGNTGMAVIHLRLGMTGSSTGKYGIVGWISMAVGTCSPLIQMFPGVNGEPLLVVVEGGRRPCILVVALDTIGGELGCGMGRIVGLVKVILVTIVACSRRIVVGTVMAGNAVVGNSQMCSGDYPILVVYREKCGFPAGVCGMAQGTGIWNIDQRVVGICWLVILRGMTVFTNRGGTRETVSMTFDAFSGVMGTGQGETCIVMIKQSGLPALIGCVTKGTILWKTISSMIWIGSSHIIRVMTIHTGSRQGDKIPGCVAFYTGSGEMCTGQREDRCVVIKGPARGGGMTSGAVSGNVIGRVIGIWSVGKIAAVTGIANGWQMSILVSLMAFGTCTVWMA
jgi:hypothetical protein